jgi:hypothetical protein
MAGSMAAIVLVPAAGAMAALLGLVPGALSIIGTLAVGVLGLGTVAALVFRRRSPFVHPRATVGVDAVDSEASPPESAPTPDRVLRLPRFLFYLGALTVAQASLRPALGLTVSELFFIAAFAATVLAALAGRPTSRVPNALVLGVGLFAIGGLISSLNAASPEESVTEVLQGVYVMLLWVWTGATVLRTRPHVLAAMTLWTISAAVDGFAAITQVAGVDTIAEPLLGTRATGLTDHPNDLGAACAIALVPALMLATSRLPGQRAAPGPGMRMPRWVILALIAAGLALSASVAAMLAGFVATLAWLVAPIVRAPGRLAVVIALAFTILAVMFAGGRVTPPTERIQQVTSTSGTQLTSGSGEVRVKAAKRALPRIAEDPIVGTGLDPAGGVVTVINQGRSTPYQIHGAPIAVWHQAGIVGLLGVLIVIVTLVRTGWRSLTAGDQNDLLIGLAIFAALISFVIYVMTAPFYFQQYGWFAGVIAIAWYSRRDAMKKVFVMSGRRRPAMPAVAPRPLIH